MELKEDHLKAAGSLLNLKFKGFKRDEVCARVVAVLLAKGVINIDDLNLILNDFEQAKVR